MPRLGFARPRLGTPHQHGRRAGGPGIAAGASLLSVVLLNLACNPKPPEAKDYVAKVSAERTNKDALFQAADDPIPKTKHAEFLPLSYFPIDPDYDVPAQLKPIEDRAVMEMPTSTGTERRMRRVGTLQFTLKGQELKLTAFVEADAKTLDRLFVPFNDLTSGTETYPGGRYMDLDRTASGIYEVDFNRAYHPYCVYNATYECPIPPPENRLKIPVRAGEKLKKSEVGSLKSEVKLGSWKT
jgi:uncharacterized protein (DUF1684 family)